MKVVGIPYVKDVGSEIHPQAYGFDYLLIERMHGNIFVNCLGKLGNAYWDVKVNDEHFRDLWELQKTKTGALWGLVCVLLMLQM